MMLLRALSQCVAFTCALLFLGVLPSSGVAATPCTVSAPLESGERVYVAVLVLGQSPTVPVGRVDNFMQLGPHGPIMAPAEAGGNGFMLYNSYYQGLHMWWNPMSARNFSLPLSNGQHVQLTPIFINVGSANWTQPDGWTQARNKAFQSNWNADNTLRNNSLLWNVTDPTRYEQFGITRPFTFAIIPPYLAEESIFGLMEHIEDLKSLIVVHPFFTSREAFVCAPVDSDPKFRTPDCVRRQRLPGQRRWQTFFSLLMDGTECSLSAVEVYHTLKVKRVAAFAAGVESGGTFGTYALMGAKEQVETLNIRMVTAMESVAAACGEAKCAHAWPGGNTSLSIARELRDADVEAVLFFGSTAAAGFTTLAASLITAFREIGYTPKNLYMGGGLETTLTRMLPPDALDFAFVTAPWDSAMRGAAFRGTDSPTSLELYPSTPSLDMPQVWFQAYESYANPLSVTPSLAMLGYSALNVVSKLVETAATDNIDELLRRAASMAPNSPYGKLSWDNHGRNVRTEQILYQFARAQDSPLGAASRDTELVFPFNVGADALYPMPTWSERVSSPNSYSDFTGSNKRFDMLILVCTSVCVAFSLGVLASVVYYRHTQVIRAATTWFCALIVFGCTLMLVSNYAVQSLVNEHKCAAQAWVLTLGFTTTFGALFAKTFRIWRIFGQARLKVTKMRDRDLLVILGALLAGDFVLNAAWQGAGGMRTELIQPDRLRPALDYTQCRYEAMDMGFVWAHTAIKSAMLLGGIVLAYAVRNVPSSFNEASLLGIGIYNVSLVLVFVIPMLQAGIGGKEAMLLIRAYAVMFVAVATQLVLFAPKWAALRARDDAGAAAVRVHGLSSHGGGNTSGTATRTKTPAKLAVPGAARPSASIGMGGGSGEKYQKSAGMPSSRTTGAGAQPLAPIASAATLGIKRSPPHQTITPPNRSPDGSCSHSQPGTQLSQGYCLDSPQPLSLAPVAAAARYGVRPSLVIGVATGSTPPSSTSTLTLLHHQGVHGHNSPTPHTRHSTLVNEGAMEAAAFAAQSPAAAGGASRTPPPVYVHLQPESSSAPARLPGQPENQSLLSAS